MTSGYALLQETNMAKAMHKRVVSKLPITHAPYAALYVLTSQLPHVFLVASFRIIPSLDEVQVNALKTVGALLQDE